jgi:hypothetical protein
MVGTRRLVTPRRRNGTARARPRLLTIRIDDEEWDRP